MLRNQKEAMAPFDWKKMHNEVLRIFIQLFANAFPIIGTKGGIKK